MKAHRQIDSPIQSTIVHTQFIQNISERHGMSVQITNKINLKRSCIICTSRHPLKVNK